MELHIIKNTHQSLNDPLTKQIQEEAQYQATHFQSIYPSEVCYCTEEHEVVFVCYSRAPNSTAITLLGCMLCNIETPITMYLSLVTVRTNTKGIGRWLIHAMSEYCRKHDIRYAYVVPIPGTTEFYTKVGFHHVSTIANPVFLRYIMKNNDVSSCKNIYALLIR